MLLPSKKKETRRLSERLLRKDMEKKPCLSIPDTDNIFKVLRSTRDEPPAHYTLKIESFSLLSKLLQGSGVDKYESKDFEAGGHKWRLLLFPDGNKKRHVDGHISLYLAMSDANNLTLGSEVNVIFKFFVFDQLREKYLTLEDGRVKSFNAFKSERGISRLLSLSTLNDPSNGYLIDDCCIFGAEVFVVKCEGKGENLTMVNEPANATFTWKLNKFSELKDELHYSEGFTVGGCQWKLRLYPCGDLSNKGKSFSLYLTLHDHSVLRSGWKVYVGFKLILQDQVHGKDFVGTGNTWFCASSQSWGFSNFIPLSYLKNEKRAFIVNDTLSVQGKITFISVVNSFA